MPIDIAPGNFDRSITDCYWIHRLDTLYPNGRKTNVLYKIVYSSFFFN